MSKQLNALEKEFLIKRFKERTDVKYLIFVKQMEYLFQLLRNGYQFITRKD